jgi:hypothetical protein
VTDVRFRRFIGHRRQRALVAFVAASGALPAVALGHDDAGDDDRPGADVALELVRSAPLAQAGDTIGVTARVENLSNRRAKRLRMAVALSGQVKLVSAAGVGWTCAVNGPLADCTRRSLRRLTVSELVVTAVAPRGFSRVGAGAAVATRDADPDERNKTATAEIAVNNPPLLVADTASTSAALPVDTEVLSNDYDPDGDPLEFAGVTQPDRGTASCGELWCRYTPPDGFSGSETYSYTVTDGRGASATTTVTVTVAPPPPPSPPPPPPPPPPPDNSDNADPGVTVDGPSVVSVGGPPVTYTAIVDNGCKVLARNVRVQFTLPAGATLLRAPRGAIRAGRVVTVPVGALRRGSPRTLRVALRFGPNGGDLRTLVVAVRSANARLSGDGIVIAVR